MFATYAASPDCSRRDCSDLRVEIPVPNCSRERDTWPSWLSSSRPRLLARCLSRSESLMWSARRKSWSGLDIAPDGLSVLSGGVLYVFREGSWGGDAY